MENENNTQLWTTHTNITQGNFIFFQQEHASAFSTYTLLLFIHDSYSIYRIKTSKQQKTNGIENI